MDLQRSQEEKVESVRGCRLNFEMIVSEREAFCMCMLANQGERFSASVVVHNRDVQRSPGYPFLRLWFLSGKYIHKYTYVCIHIYIYQSVSLITYQFISISIVIIIYLPISPSIYLPVYLPTFLSLFIYLYNNREKQRTFGNGIKGLNTKKTKFHLY